MSEETTPEIDEAQVKFEALQADYNSRLEELNKYKNESTNYKKRAEKAERLAKTKADPDELNDWKQKFEIVNEKNVKFEDELSSMRNLQKSNTINKVILGRSNEYSKGTANVLPVLIDAQTRLENGVLTVIENVNGKQQVRLNKTTLRPMTIDELRDEILETTPTLLNAKTNGGTGSTGNQSSGNALMSIEELQNKSPKFISDYRSKLNESELAELNKQATIER